MFKNYLNIAFRNLKKYKGFSFINILGLAVGMACTLLILLWVQDELSYDRFFPNAARLYRVIDSEKYSNGEKSVFSMNPPSLAKTLINEYPEIINAARLRTVKNSVLQYKDKRFTEDNLMFVDPSFLKMFSIHFLKGNENDALSNLSSIIITKETAEKYFGNKNPVGKIIKINNHLNFEVTGVIKNIPLNSHLKIDLLLPFDAIKDFGYTLEGWESFAHTTYVLLNKNADFHIVSKKISNTIIQHQKDINITIGLQPVTDIHLYSGNIWGIGGTGDITQVYLFSIIALLILLLACINFINLSTARSGSRAKEIGMRKVVGASRKEIIVQFFLESIIYAFISLILSIILVYDLLPAFNSLSGKELSFNLQNNFGLLLLTLGIAVFTGIISGVYPALFLSAFKPVKVLKGKFSAGSGNKNFRKPLVTFQFILTIILIIGTVVVNRQLHFIQNKNLGFNKEYVLCINLQGKLNKKADLIKNELSKDRQVISISGVSYPPSGVLSSTDVNDWEGKKTDNHFLIYRLTADQDFTKTMQINMIKGRFFSKKFSSDTADGCIINQAALHAMDMISPLGKKVLNFRIIGVIKDFNFSSLHSQISPLIIYYDPSEIKDLLVRIKPGEINSTIKSLEQTWDKIAPEYPFEYSFLDEQINKLYQSDQKISKVINTFSFLALFIACLGMFGLASYTAEQRTKEVGVRKILGANVTGIVFLLSKEFTQYVLAANLFAWPAAYFVLNKWLGSFAYHIDMQLWMFIVPGLIAFSIACFSVSYQAIKAALLYPIKSLRYE
ncbi:MAG: ABC transporter permease [Ignavibacteriaceae bacterium]